MHLAVGSGGKFEIAAHFYMIFKTNDYEGCIFYDVGLLHQLTVTVTYRRT